jgi:hypothetical protein
MAIESDRAEILSGVRHGRTTGAPIALMIRNQDRKKLNLKRRRTGGLHGRCLNRSRILKKGREIVQPPFEFFPAFVNEPHCAR